MTCQRARDLFSARADSALSAAEQTQLDAHLATCAECQREWTRFERTVTLVQAIEPAHAPVGFVDRVLAAQARPWYARLAREVFVPWSVKLPLEAAAVVLVAGLAIMILQVSPELQQASRLAEPRTESAPSLASEPPAIATAPPAKAREAPSSDAAAPAATTPPTTTGSRMDPATTLGRVSPSQAPAPVTTTPPRAPAPTATAESRAKIDEERKALRKEADPSGELRSARKAPAEDQSANRENLAQGYAPISAGLRARLAVGERAAAESTVRDLVARAGGQVLSQVKDRDAAMLNLLVPADRWDELRRGLEALGTLRVEGQKAEGAGQLLVTLRLER